MMFYPTYSCCYDVLLVYVFFFFKQKTAYEMRISDWSSDVCSSDLGLGGHSADALRRGDGRPSEGLLRHATLSGCAFRRLKNGTCHEPSSHPTPSSSEHARTVPGLTPVRSWCLHRQIGRAHV